MRGDITEASPRAELQEIAEEGFDLILVGSMSVATNTSNIALVTGGQAMSTGISGFTLKGVDPQSGTVLFIVSTEYGTSRDVGEVAADLAETYHQLVTGQDVG